MAAKNKSAKKTAKKPVRKKAVKKVNQMPAKKKSAAASGVSTGSPPPITVSGQNPAALFTLKIYRGEGMALLAMNWSQGKPPDNFAGFAIEFQEPGGTQFFALKNRLSFLENDGNENHNILSTRLSPIQKFRWIHFPFNPNLPGNFIYRVTPVFMDRVGQLSYGDFQQAAVPLQAETYPGILNVAFTRGFIASQAFVDQFGTNGGVGTLLPTNANKGLSFVSSDPNETKALDWMGFEDRIDILNTLDQAIKDPSAQVRVTAYDFNEPEILSRLVKLGKRLKVIIDDSGTHGATGSAENAAAQMLKNSAGVANVQRQHMGQLQHNKTIAVSGKVQLAICGSTNLSWRGIFVQNNNAVILHGAIPVNLFFDAFDNLWNNKNNPAGFGATASSGWNNLQLPGVQAKISFSPHTSANALLANISSDIASTQSSLFYSLAFLFETPGPILNAIKKVTGNKQLFVYGISDKSVGGLDLQVPNGNPPIVFPSALLTNVPEPFKQEATGGSGARMHHKFVVIDFDKPTARVYTGSYNFSTTADLKNGENLLLIQDRRVAVSYMIQAVLIFDHYEFRDALAKSTAPTKRLFLKTPPKNPGDKPWWDEDYTVPQKIRDRELFSSFDAP
jgi:phosphatidylserine/phosphatidylglycerophosphate/cardiolipin synthase-like enzyme